MKGVAWLVGIALVVTILLWWLRSREKDPGMTRSGTNTIVQEGEKSSGEKGGSTSGGDTTDDGKTDSGGAGQPSGRAENAGRTPPAIPETGTPEARDARRHAMGDAAERGDLSALERLRGQGAPVGAAPTDDDFAPVHRAAIAGQTDSLRWLHQHGADLDARIGEGLLAGFTSLDLARHFNHPATAEWLEKTTATKP